jgi:EF hand
MGSTWTGIAAAALFGVPLATASAASDSMLIAQSARGSADGRFEQLDRNHDGYISRNEAKDADELNTRFTELDKNNDGKLSRDEYNALNEGGSGASGSGSVGASGADQREPGRSPAPGKGGGDASTSGANTK